MNTKFKPIKPADLAAYISADDVDTCSTRREHLRLIAERIIDDVSHVAEPPPVRDFTVITVSSNANSFGYKGVCVLAEDGTGYECAFQAYGSDPLPKRGDVIPEDRLPRSLVWRRLPWTPLDHVARLFAEAKKGGES